MEIHLARNLTSLNLALDALDEWIVVVDDAAKIQFINLPYPENRKAPSFMAEI